MNAPQATIGLDVQWSRTTVVLREEAGDRRAEMLVGDGRRGHIPNAVHGDAWATAAVEAGCRTANGARPACRAAEPTR